MDVWTLKYDEYDPEAEGHREAMCTLGNGYFATRGAAPESAADDVHYPGTYFAGLYDRAMTEVGGRKVENEDLVNATNWLPLTFRVDGGAWFSIDDVEIEEFLQELEIKRGVLARRVRFRFEGRTTTLRQRRFVHMGQRHVAGLETTIVAEDWSGRVEVLSALDGTVENAGVERYRSLEGRHARPHDTGVYGDDIVLVETQTLQSHIRIAFAQRTRVFRGDEAVEAEREVEEREAWIGHKLAFDMVEGEAVRIEKIVSGFLSRDRATSEPCMEARNHVERARDCDGMLASHELAWHPLWRRFRIGMRPKGRAQLILNLHIFHLLQTVSFNSLDLDIGVPARGWHGEAYRGHVFWDELFIFPFLNLRMPELTRALLMYRHRRLPEARHAAYLAGYDGAMFPWQSGSNGREETQILHLNPRSGEWMPDNSSLQRHVNIAIAYNVWQYYQVTEDVEFLSYYGAEMVLEIARFWASLTTFDEEKDRFVVLGVMGPDEYHDAYPGAETAGLDNNAFTNVMVVWCMMRALDALAVIPHSRREMLVERLGIRDEELERWEEISTKMFIPCCEDGIMAQFEGYEDLEEFDWAGYREKYGDIQRLDRILGAEGDTANRFKASKQADVLMLFYLLSMDELSGLIERLGYDCPSDALRRNVDYYIQRTSHGSTLSGVVHSWVLARSDREASWEFFKDALESDVSDIHGGTTREGIHLGAMAGTVDLIQRGYTGIETREDMLWVDPALPSEIESIKLEVRYRGQWVRLEVEPEKMTIRTDPAEDGDVRVGYRDKIIDVPPGASREIALD